jgi:hypothetical protein
MVFLRETVSPPTLESARPLLEGGHTCAGARSLYELRQDSVLVLFGLVIVFTGVLDLVLLVVCTGHVAFSFRASEPCLYVGGGRASLSVCPGHGEANGRTAKAQQERQVVGGMVDDEDAAQMRGPIFLSAMAGISGRTKRQVEAANPRVEGESR